MSGQSNYIPSDPSGGSRFATKELVKQILAVLRWLRQFAVVGTGPGLTTKPLGFGRAVCLSSTITDGYTGDLDRMVGVHTDPTTGDLHVDYYTDTFTNGLLTAVSEAQQKTGEEAVAMVLDQLAIDGSNLVRTRRTIKVIGIYPGGTDTNLLTKQSVDVVVGSTYSDPSFTNQHSTVAYWGDSATSGSDENVFTAVECP